MKDIEKALNLKSYVDSQLLISEEYHDLIDIFKKKNADKLTSYCEEYDLKIELESGKTSSFRPLYRMSQKELTVLQKYLDEHLTKKFIVTYVE